MSYPAFADFFLDPERTTARICVYMAIQPPLLCFVEPRPLKLDVVHRQARISRGQASKALGWLILRGYLVVHARDSRGMPFLTISYALKGSQVPSGNRLAG